MRMNSIRLFSLGMALSVLFATRVACAGVFLDGFEGATIDPFWTVRTNSGSITFPSTAQVHSGAQSVQFNSTNTGSQKYISLEHTFAAPVYGIFSVWAYDSGADVFSSNYIAFQTDLISDPTQRNSIFGNDYDLANDNYFLNPDSSSTIDSGVNRTRGWHQFLFDITPALTTFKIDGATVYTKPGGAMDHVLLYMGGPSWRPEFTTHFDDFSFVSFDVSTVPEPSSVVLWSLFGLAALVYPQRIRSKVNL
jgi:hypothetical protein